MKEILMMGPLLGDGGILGILLSTLYALFLM